AVERESTAGQRAGPEGQHIGAAAGFEKALAIAREHFEIGEQVVRPEHGLSAAKVRVAGNDGVRILAREIEKRAQHSVQAAENCVDLFPQPESDVERNLLVAAAPGMNLVGEAADAVLEAADDERVDVFVGGVVEEPRRAGVEADLFERGYELFAFGGGE